MKRMKLALMFVALAAISTDSWAAMNVSDIRREARFLTDRMGHELGLSNRQYEDVYEINFDFLYQVNEVIDDVVYGYDDAVDYYYYLLDVRNEDLVYVLRDRQYRRFVKRDYFYRPIYMVGNSWGMRIYSHYTDLGFYYYGAPVGYHTYIGAHYRIHFVHSYYANRYSHALYHGAFRLWGGGHDHRHHDGWVSSGKKMSAGSRDWSNKSNYEKSRHELKNGYVSVPSRDKDKRVVSVNSEENRRTVVASDASTRRTGSSREAVGASNSAPTRSNDNASVRSGAASSSNRSNSSSVRESAATSSSRSGSATKERVTGNTNRTSSSSTSSKSSSVSTSRSGSSSKSSSVSSSRSSSSAKSSSVSTSRSSSSSSSSSRSGSSSSSRSSSATRR